MSSATGEACTIRCQHIAAATYSVTTAVVQAFKGQHSALACFEERLGAAGKAMAGKACSLSTACGLGVDLPLPLQNAHRPRRSSTE